MASHSEPFAPGDNRMGTGCVGRGRDGGGGGGYCFSLQIPNISRNGVHVLLCDSTVSVTACTYYSVTVLSV